MKNLVSVLALSVALATPSMALAANVVASVKPVHALVSAVMQGVGEPQLLVEGSASPHAYSLRPSDADALQNADLIFWIGEDLETFLLAPLETLGANAKSVALDDAPGLQLLPIREDAAFEAHDHDHEGEAHDEDEHEHEEEHAHEDEHEDEHDHEEEHADEDGHDHEHGHMDAHFWLDPLNAKAMVGAIATALIESDPDHADIFKANAAKTEAALDALIVEISAQLEPAKNKPFIVFHDAYQYFEHRFDIHAAGAITLNPEIMPGARRVAEIRDTIKDRGAICVFAEPQFTPRQVETLIADTGVKAGTLDPLGAAIEAGPDHYATLLRQLAKSLSDCLAD